MNIVTGAVTGVLACLCATTAMAQVTAVPAAPVATIIASPGGNVLRAGTQIALRTAEPLTTEGKLLRVVQLEVAEAVQLNNQVIIPAGSPAVGEITDIRNKGMWGKSGHISARVLYVRANGTQIRLTGQFDDKGKTGTAGVVAAIAFVPIAGFITTGTSAKIPLGAPVTGFLDEDISVAFAPTQPTTISVPAPQPVQATPAAPAALPKPTTAALVDPSLEINPR